MSGAALAAAARALVGCRFRVNGRDPATGLDCLGVVAASLEAIGRSPALPPRRALRCLGDGGAGEIACTAGLVPTTDCVAPGDVLLVRCSPVQLHVLIAVTAERFVHTHACLGRVVVSALDPVWPVLARWRLPANG